MKDIIKKLDIIPIEWFMRDGEGVCLESAVREVEQQNRDMLNVLIILEKEMGIDLYDMFEGTLKIQLIIEKVTGKSWEEIKRLYNASI